MTQAGEGTKVILVIDDEETVRDAFQLALEDYRCTVTVAAGGEQGLERLQAQRPDLVFLDLNMPGMNGVEVLRRIKAWDAAIPVYIVTAFWDLYFDQLRQAALDGLEFEVLRKPLGAEEIGEVVVGTLGGRIVPSGEQGGS